MKEQEWDSKKTCSAGSESEAGWAIGSAVAYSVSAPGCVLPIFENAAIFHCITKTAWLTTDSRAPASVVETPTVNSVATIPGISSTSVETKFQAVDKAAQKTAKVGKDQ
jgi:hypothetical protein